VLWEESCDLRRGAGAASDRASASSPCPSMTSLAPRWLVICSCGWTREAVSEWAAKSISKLHPRLAQLDEAHVTRVEGPDDSPGERQLTLV
jgi:hypothetical protein